MCWIYELLNERYEGQDDCFSCLGWYDTGNIQIRLNTPRVWKLATSEEKLLRRDPVSCVAPSLLLISLHPLMQFSLFGGFLLPYCARLSLTKY